MTLDSLPLWFYRGFGVALGLLWGSFLNVVIWRVPRGMSVVRPPSHCPACQVPIKAWQNVPVLGWLALRGRSACCGVRIPVRYPIVEAAGGLLAWGVLETRVLTLSPHTSLAFAGAVFVAWLALALALLAAAFIDAEHLYLPDGITIGGVVLGIATASLRQQTFLDAAIGAAVGFVIVWLPFIAIYERLRGMAGMGMGDAKLLALAGAWFGWPGALVVLGAGAIQGAVGTLAIMLVTGKVGEPEAVAREREAILAEIEALPAEEREAALEEWHKDPIAGEQGEGLRARIPFGPFLILAILELAFFERPIFEVLLPGGELW